MVSKKGWGKSSGYDLEKLLQEHFSCKVPFRKDGTLTTTGEKAVLKLMNLLNDLEYCGLLEAKEPISEINSILSEKFNKS